MIILKGTRMKSIIQEASSIAKAIEEGWIKAQKPQQFSVKILEEAEKNFLGLTKKSAKVAIFFDEPQLNKPSEHRPGQQAYKQQSPYGKATEDRQSNRQQPQQPRPQHEKPSSYAKATDDRQPARQQQPQRPQQQLSSQVENAPQQSAQPKKQFEPLWNQAMVDRTQQWMRDAFKNSGNEHIQFSVEPQKFHLRITLSAPILTDPDKEKQLLASFSALILETLKRSFKMSLRGHKIVLTHNKK